MMPTMAEVIAISMPRMVSATRPSASSECRVMRRGRNRVAPIFTDIPFEALRARGRGVAPAPSRVPPGGAGHHLEGYSEVYEAARHGPTTAVS
jgi:hypothetical protein